MVCYIYIYIPRVVSLPLKKLPGRAGAPFSCTAWDIGTREERVGGCLVWCREIGSSRCFFIVPPSLPLLFPLPPYSRRRKVNRYTYPAYGCCCPSSFSPPACVPRCGCGFTATAASVTYPVPRCGFIEPCISIALAKEELSISLDAQTRCGGETRQVSAQTRFSPRLAPSTDCPYTAYRIPKYFTAYVRAGYSGRRVEMRTCLPCVSSAS